MILVSWIIAALLAGILAALVYVAAILEDVRANTLDGAIGIKLARDEASARDDRDFHRP